MEWRIALGEKRAEPGWIAVNHRLNASARTRTGRDTGLEFEGGLLFPSNAAFAIQ